MGFGYIRRRSANPLRRRKPAAVRQVRRRSRSPSRDGRDEVVLHTGQHYDRELSEVFFEELGLSPPALPAGGRLGHATREQTARMLPGIEAAVLEESPTWCSSTATRTRRSPGRWRRASSACPSRTSRPVCAPSTATMPEELNRILVDRRLEPPLLPERGRRAEPHGRGGHRRRPRRRRRHARREPPPRSARPRALRRPRPERGRAATRYLLLTLHREANTDARVAGADRRRRSAALEEPVVFPAHPRTTAALAGARHRAPGERPRPPAGRLSRLRRARLPGTPRPHGLRRSAEGGLLVPRALRDAADDDRVGRDRASRLEPSGRRRSRGDRRARSPKPGPGEEHPPLYGDGDAAVRIAGSCCVR